MSPGGLVVEPRPFVDQNQVQLFKPSQVGEPWQNMKSFQSILSFKIKFLSHHLKSNRLTLFFIVMTKKIKTDLQMYSMSLKGRTDKEDRRIAIKPVRVIF